MQGEAPPKIRNTPPMPWLLSGVTHARRTGGRFSAARKFPLCWLGACGTIILMKRLHLSATVSALLTGLVFTCLALGQAAAPPTTPTPPALVAPPARPVAERVVTPIDRQTLVLYEVNLRAMSAQGNLAGVTARLDAIQRVGCNVVWLMPIHPVGQIRSVGGLGSPYSVRDYKAIGQEYGTLQDLRTLVAAAHARNMRVILDWVANHTAWDHAWITAHPDYYTHDAAGHIIIPPGTTWNDVADLNYSNKNMRNEMIAAMHFWLDQAGIDGFRCDAAEMVPADFWADAIKSLRASGRPLLMLAEGATPQLSDAGFDLLYGWDHYGATKEVFGKGAAATAIRDAHNRECPPSATIKDASRLRFTTNHDETAWDNTPIALFGGTDGSLAAFAIAAWHGGVPLVYSGQEIGWPVKLPFFSLSQIDWNTGAATSSKYAEILSIRQRLFPLLYGGVTDASTNDAVIFLRSAPGRDALVMINVRNHDTVVTLPTTVVGPWQNERASKSETLAASITLKAYQYLVYSRPAGMRRIDPTP